MIDVVIRIKVAPGKVGSHAVKFASKMLAYEKRAGLSAPGSLLQPMTGDGHEIVFVSRYPSMSEYEENYRKLRADSGWMEIAKEILESDWYLGLTRRIYDVVEVVE
ncbi:MAG: hypothetical protein V3V36_03830 [Candidatus Hydrothermarchaeaceae archaeon]